MDALQLLIEEHARWVGKIDGIERELARVGERLAEAGSWVPGWRDQPVANPLFKREVELRGDLRLTAQELANCEVRPQCWRHPPPLPALIEERIERLSAEIASTGEMVTGSEKQPVGNPLLRRRSEFKNELTRTKRDIARCEAQIDRVERQLAADARRRGHLDTRRAPRRTAR